LNNDQCVCTRVCSGQPLPGEADVMTKFGSFRCSDAIEHYKGLSEAEKTHFRGKCIKLGFKSLAVVPIRYKEHIIGVIHLGG